MPHSLKSNELSTCLTVSVKIPTYKGRETFIETARKEAGKKARRVWDTAFPEIKNRKRGRPNEKQAVYDVCETILLKCEGIFPFRPFGKESPQRRYPSVGDWIEEIHRNLKEQKNPLDKKTIKKHFLVWLIDSSKTTKGFLFKLPVKLLHYVTKNSRELRPGMRAIIEVGLETGKKFYGPYFDKLFKKYSFDQILEMEKGKKIPPTSLKKKAEAYRKKRLEELALNSPTIRGSLALLQTKIDP